MFVHDQDLWRDVVRCATAAPSSHNTQPWLFHLHEDRLELRMDRRRALPVNDPRNRELTISCGTALFNARVCVHHLGFVPRVELVPDPADDPGLLATLELGDPSPPDPEFEALFSAIPRRHTNRKSFDDAAVDPRLAERISEAVAKEGAWLHLVEPSQRTEIAGLVAEGDRRQWSNKAWRRELAAWMHPRRRRDGLTLPPVAAAVAPRVVRAFNLGRGQARRDEQLAEEAPLLAVIGTESGSVQDCLRAGMALERALLVAAHEGVQAGYLNQPIQVEALRSSLARTIGRSGQPQLLLRIGHPASELKAAPRRRVREVLVRA